MKHNVYSIYDKASVHYMRIFQAKADGEVLRTFRDMALNKDHEIGAHPEDYSLWRIGTFDDNTGKLVAENFECLGRAHELVAAARTVDADAIEKLDAEILEMSPGGTK